MTLRTTVPSRAEARFALPLAATLVFSACAGPQSGSRETEILTETGTTAEQTLGTAVLVGPLFLDNPTAAEASLDAATYVLRIDDQGGPIEKRGEVQLDVRAGAGQKTRGELRVEVELPASREALEARKDMPSLSWQLTATFKMKSGKGLEEVEAEWFGKLYPPKPPEITVEAQAARSEGHLELRFFVGVNNPNPFPLSVAGLTYQLKVLDIDVAQGELARDRRLEAASGWELEIHRYVGRDDLKDLAKTLSRKKSIPYSIAAQLRLGSPDDPPWDIPLAGEIDFD